MKYNTILFPMTAEILTAGHIKCFDYLDAQCDFLIVSLLTNKALRGYKKCVVPYKDRETILKSIYNVYMVVPQDTLNPYDNLKKYECDAIASGDGWEKEEVEGAKKLKVKMINIPFPKKWSSKSIKQKVVDQQGEKP